jgi:hypothetical protein
MSDSLSVSLSTDLYVPRLAEIRVRHRHDFVYLIVGDKAVEMRTPAAHRTGFALVKKAGEALPGEFVKLVINGVALNFPPKSAKQIGASLLRKADAVDDFQLQRVSK